MKLNSYFRLSTKGRIIYNLIGMLISGSMMTSVSAMSGVPLPCSSQGGIDFSPTSACTTCTTIGKQRVEGIVTIIGGLCKSINGKVIYSETPINNWCVGNKQLQNGGNLFNQDGYLQSFC